MLNILVISQSTNYCKFNAFYAKQWYFIPPQFLIWHHFKAYQIQRNSFLGLDSLMLSLECCFHSADKICRLFFLHLTKTSAIYTTGWNLDLAQCVIHVSSSGWSTLQFIKFLQIVHSLLGRYKPKSLLISKIQPASQ